MRKTAKTAATTAAVRTCEASRYATAQQELDAADRALMEHLYRGQKMKLRTAQQVWLRFRDANADFQASLLQGLWLRWSELPAWLR
jgi:uncharacterized protein YecT (DUF1311 family)